MLRNRVLFSLLFAGLVATPALGQEATLEWKLEKDKSFYQTMATSTTQDMKVTGSDVKQTQEQTFYFQWTPTMVEEATAELKMKILGLKMDMKIGESRVSYDSTVQDPPGGPTPLANFFKALVGLEFTVTLDRKEMKVTKIEGQEDLVKKLGDANPQMKPLLEQILSENAMKEMTQSMFAALPGKAVKKDETWKREAELDMGPFGKYDTTYTYTYEGETEQDKEKLQKITAKTELKYTPPDPSKEAAGLPFKIKDAKLEVKDGESTGTILYDPKAGWIRSSEMNLNLSGDLTIEISGQSTTVNLTQTQKSTLTTSDKNPVEAAR